MNFKSYRFQVILRVLILGIIIAVFIYAIYQPQWYVASSVSFVFIIFSLIELIRYVEKVNRELAKFLFSIKHKDFTNTYSIKDEGKSFSVLKDAFSEIIGEFQNVRIEKEVHYQYLNSVIDHINIAVICYEKDGNVQLVNNSAMKLFNLPKLLNISSLDTIHPKIYNSLKEIKTGKNELVKVKLHDEIVHLSIQAIELKMLDKHLKLVSIQNIKNELEVHELESWQKLIRVLTHEIMNSVTPISSLSAAINEIILKESGDIKDLNTIDPEDISDLTNSMRTIETRSKGLLKFISSYKSLTRLPKPEFEEIIVAKLIDNILLLHKKDIENNNIKICIDFIDSRLTINADRKMIEQVLINLLKNAIEILYGKNDGQINVLAHSFNDNTNIEISDNGPGIDEDRLEKIFIPFFTTKQNGSGIGLSLSRQIMRLHGGSISVNSEPGKGSSFILKF
ncbi:PAS domain-containing sensor histidine kinase [Bacteroidota bacterium]